MLERSFSGLVELLLLLPVCCCCCCWKWVLAP
jgi:hypothetical protein